MFARFFLSWLAAGLLLPVVGTAEPVTVKTALLKDIAIYPERTAPASVVSLNETTVSAEIAAVVTGFPARVGDTVEAGALLLLLDCSDYILAERRAQATLEALEARVKLAAKQLERARVLEQQQSVAVEIVDVRIAELAVLEAEKQIAIANQDTALRNATRCQVKSPYRGLVTERISAVGQLAGVGTPLVRLLDLSAIEVSAQVSSDETAQINAADTLYFSFADRRFPLRVRTVLPAINPATRNQEVRLVFSGDAAISGAAGKLIWSDYRPHISSDLLINRNGRLGIFVNENGTARFLPLAAAQASRTTPVELPADTQIIIEGHFSLQDNTGVTVDR